MSEDLKGHKFDRTDRATRLLIDGLSSVTSQLEEARKEIKEERAGRTQQVKEQVEGHMKAYVPWVAFGGTLIALLALVITITDKQTAPGKTAAEKSQAAAEAALKQGMDFQREVLSRLDKQDAKLDANVSVTVRGEKASVAKEELERRTGEKRTPRR